MFPATKKRKKKDARGICSVHLVENKKKKKIQLNTWLTTIIRTNSNSRYFFVFLEE